MKVEKTGGTQRGRESERDNLRNENTKGRDLEQIISPQAVLPKHLGGVGGSLIGYC